MRLVRCLRDVIPQSRTEINYQLYFFQGDTYKTIDLTIRNDSTPETHEVFVVQLSNIQTFDIASTGQASFIPGKTTATVSISASDRPHGVVELEAGSRLVSRADEKNFTLTVSRLFGNMGKWLLGLQFLHSAERVVFILQSKKLTHA